DGINLGVLLREGQNIRFYHQSLHGYFAAEKLGSVLNKLTLDTKVVLIRQIGDLREAASPSVEPLIHVLTHERGVARYAAAEALGQIGDTRAVRPLINLIDSEEKIMFWRLENTPYKSQSLRSVAARALGKI